MTRKSLFVDLLGWFWKTHLTVIQVEFSPEHHPRIEIFEFALTWWPFHFAIAEEVDVEMKDGLSGFGS
jgi:hypothetical protein